MRHGKPGIGKRPRLNAAQFGQWVEHYNAAGIDTGHPPPPLAIEQASRCAITVCSNLPRSLESASILGVRQDLIDPMFREMDMPHAAWRHPRLPAIAWSVFFRLVWVLGYSAGVESFKAARERARRCAEQLAGLAQEHRTALFVGHGSLNWFIARYLARMGWSCAGRPPRQYWEFCVFQFQESRLADLPPQASGHPPSSLPERTD